MYKRRQTDRHTHTDTHTDTHTHIHIHTDRQQRTVLIFLLSPLHLLPLASTATQGGGGWSVLRGTVALAAAAEGMEAVVVVVVVVVVVMGMVEMNRAWDR